jgi:hypothetical protein
MTLLAERACHTCHAGAAAAVSPSPRGVVCAHTGAMGDPLFTVLNNFHCGAYQLAINAAQELDDLPSSAALERDCLVYRAYVALGQHQARGAQTGGDPAALGGRTR